MSYSRCLSLSALLASTFITPVTAMDLTPVSSDNNAILEYTHTYTPVPEPASSFADMSRSYQTAGICFLGVGDCDPNVGFGKGDSDYTMDTAAQCRNEGFVNSCSSGYCMDGSCSYNASYGKCIAENCPTNSSPTCTGAVIGKTACGGNCKQCCSDTCASGSKSYTGSYASTTECGSTCYYCSNSCPSGSTSYSGSYASTTECGSSCYYCSSSCSSGSTSISCSSGYTKTSVGSTECGSTCYECVKDDPCDNYTSKTCDYGCASYYSDCSTKCQTCYSDNCHNRTAVIASCPANATCSYFSDCSSKIQSWSCNSGYSKSGSSCVEDTPCISYDGQDCAYNDCPTYTCTCCPSFGGFNSSCCVYDDMCTTTGHPMCTDAVPYVVGSCCCPTSTQTSTYNCDCCTSEL